MAMPSDLGDQWFGESYAHHGNPGSTNQYISHDSGLKVAGRQTWHLPKMSANTTPFGYKFPGCDLNTQALLWHDHMGIVVEEADYNAVHETGWEHDKILLFLKKEGWAWESWCWVDDKIFLFLKREASAWESWCWVNDKIFLFPGKVNLFWEDWICFAERVKFELGVRFTFRSELILPAEQSMFKFTPERDHRFTSRLL
jgi:hypothetical protein